MHAGGIIIASNFKISNLLIIMVGKFGSGVRSTNKYINFILMKRYLLMKEIFSR